MTASLLAFALLPPRPSYVLKAGETYRYRYESLRNKELQERNVWIQVKTVARNGDAELTVTVAKPTDEAPESRRSVRVDRWLYARANDDTSFWGPLLRLEKPGLRKGATYSVLPGDYGTSLYEVRDETGATGAMKVKWRKSILLAADGLPRSAEVRSEFESGDPIVQTLTRIDEILE